MLIFINGHNHKKILLSLLFALMLGAILLLAGGLPDLRFQPGVPFDLLGWILAQLDIENLGDVPETKLEPTGPGFWDSLSETMRGSIIIIFWLTLIFSIIYAVVSPEFRRELVRMFMVVLTLVVLLPYIARRMTHQIATVETEGAPGEFLSANKTFPEPPPFIQQPPEWLLIMAKGLLLALFLGAIYLLWRYLRPKSDAQAIVARHIRKALSDLESGLEFEDVVIVCYARMCQELQKIQQVQRQKDMTPREFATQLANAGISSVHIRQLTQLFEGARYGEKPTDPAKEHQARQNLQAILKAYGE